MKVKIGKYPKTAARRVDVQIDDQDLWNADHTLALVIHPLLQKMENAKNGSPAVDDEDVPEELRSTNSEPIEFDWDIDSNWHSRWKWVLAEMTWAFGEIADAEWEHQYFSNGFDREAYEAHSAKIDNGLRLFGKYYRSLWT
jgi:hypothetical protein